MFMCEYVRGIYLYTYIIILHLIVILSIISFHEMYFPDYNLFVFDVYAMDSIIQLDMYVSIYRCMIYGLHII